LQEATVPFFDTTTFHLERFELKEQRVLLRFEGRRVDEANGLSFTGRGGPMRIGLALGITARLFG